MVTDRYTAPQVQSSLKCKEEISNTVTRVPEIPASPDIMSVSTWEDEGVWPVAAPPPPNGPIPHKYSGLHLPVCSRGVVIQSQSLSAKELCDQQGLVFSSNDRSEVEA